MAGNQFVISTGVFAGERESDVGRSMRELAEGKTKRVPGPAPVELTFTVAVGDDDDTVSELGEKRIADPLGEGSAAGGISRPEEGFFDGFDGANDRLDAPLPQEAPNGRDELRLHGAGGTAATEHDAGGTKTPDPAVDEIDERIRAISGRHMVQVVDADALSDETPAVDSCATCVVQIEDETDESGRITNLHL